MPKALPNAVRAPLGSGLADKQPSSIRIPPAHGQMESIPLLPGSIAMAIVHIFRKKKEKIKEKEHKPFPLS